MRFLPGFGALIAMLLVGQPVAAQLTPEQALETAKQWERAVAMRDYDSIDRLWSDEGFFQRVTAGVNVSAQKKEQFRARLGTKRGRAGIEQFIQQRGSVGGYKLLTIIKRSDGPHAIFRVVDTTGFDYHELIVDNVNGALRIVDIYLFRTGESLAQAFRRLLICEAAAEQGQPIPPQYQALAQMQRASSEQQYFDVLKVYDGQPDAVQRDKLIQIQRLGALLKVRNEEYEAARRAYESLHPSDVTPDVLALDTLIGAAKYKECREAIDRIDAIVSGDPYLLVLRAGVAQAEGKPDTARMMCDKALVLEPTLLPAADALLTDALDRRDFKTAKSIMLKMERSMYFTFGPLDQSQTFKDFIESPEYLEFEKERPRR